MKEQYADEFAVVINVKTVDSRRLRQLHLSAEMTTQRQLILLAMWYGRESSLETSSRSAARLICRTLFTSRNRSKNQLSSEAWADISNHTLFSCLHAGKAPRHEHHSLCDAEVFWFAQDKGLKVSARNETHLNEGVLERDLCSLISITQPTWCSSGGCKLCLVLRLRGVCKWEGLSKARTWGQFRSGVTRTINFSDASCARG